MKGTSQSGLWTMGKGEFEESVKALEAAIAEKEGSPRQLFDLLRTEAAFAQRVAEFMLLGAIEGSVSREVARAIMGKNFWGPEEWLSFYGVFFTKKQLRKVADFPWAEDVLNTPCPFVKGKAVKDTHFAFLGLDRVKGKPLTILKWREIHPATGQPRFYSYAPDAWYSREEFATSVTCGFRWYLVLLEIMSDSTNKTFGDQVAMLSPEYEVPQSIVEVTKDILYYRKYGAYLNPIRWGRCQDVSSSGHRVGVGGFDECGLRVPYDWDAYRCCLIGLAASRKFPARGGES